jgi:hypothetical protein
MEGGMAAVLGTPYYAERCARSPENRNRLLAIDPNDFISTMQRWQRFFLDGAEMPVTGVFCLADVFLDFLERHPEVS